jgi:hypothetical protein
MGVIAMWEMVTLLCLIGLALTFFALLLKPGSKNRGDRSEKAPAKRKENGNNDD